MRSLLVNVCQSALVLLVVSTFAVATEEGVSKSGAELPERLVKIWQCEMKKVEKSADTSVAMEAQWTEELRADGRIFHRGPMKVSMSGFTAELMISGEGHWHATATEFTSGFESVELKPLNDNRLTQHILSNQRQFENDFKEIGTEEYILSDGTFVRTDKDLDITVVCQ